MREKRALVRVVHTPDDRYLLDVTGKLTGRGAYLCPAAECLFQAVKRKSFERAFRNPVPREALEALRGAIESYLGAGSGAAEQPPAAAAR